MKMGQNWPVRIGFGSQMEALEQVGNQTQNGFLRAAKSTGSKKRFDRRDRFLCDDGNMKLKTMEEGKMALDNFTRTMRALFRVPKSEVREAERKFAARKKRAKSRG